MYMHAAAPFLHTDTPLTLVQRSHQCSNAMSRVNAIYASGPFGSFAGFIFLLRSLLSRPTRLLPILHASLQQSFALDSNSQTPK